MELRAHTHTPTSFFSKMLKAILFVFARSLVSYGWTSNDLRGPEGVARRLSVAPPKTISYLFGGSTHQKMDDEHAFKQI